jgi:hypothetical protein
VKTSSFKVDDNVAYSVRFLEDIQMSHSEIAHMRGTILELKTGIGPEIAMVKWDDGNQALVRTGCLAHVGPNMEFCKC